MKEESIEMKNEEIGRLKREIAVLYPFAEGKTAWLEAEETLVFIVRFFIFGTKWVKTIQFK